MIPAEIPPQPAPVAVVSMTVPERIPLACVKQSSEDYGVPQMLLLAILKQESNARAGAIGKNSNGTYDIGPAQFNTASWVPYFANRYGIRPEALANDMCQAIRAMAYAIRTEANTSTCRGEVLWCGVGRYHAPRNEAARTRYIIRVDEKLRRMIRTGRFD